MGIKLGCENLDNTRLTALYLDYEHAIQNLHRSTTAKWRQIGEILFGESKKEERQAITSKSRFLPISLRPGLKDWIRLPKDAVDRAGDS